jgi:hypothetical protein
MAWKVWDTMGTFKTAFILVAIVTVLLLVSIMLTGCYDEATKAGAGSQPRKGKAFAPECVKLCCAAMKKSGTCTKMKDPKASPAKCPKTSCSVRENAKTCQLRRPGCKDKSGDSKGEDMDRGLKITWQRLVDEKGQTCQRCGTTEKELQEAFQSLQKSLAPLGIKVTLEKKSLDHVTCAKDISQSNRIWVEDRSLEEWLGAKVGKSACGFCCAELGDQVQCRTVEVEGQVYETIPADLIIRAGLLAAADLYKGTSAQSCCPGDYSTKSKNGCSRPDF